MTFPYAYYDEKYIGPVHGSAHLFSYGTGFYSAPFRGFNYSAAGNTFFSVDSRAFSFYKPALLSDGTLAAPSLSFTSAPNVGFFRKPGETCFGTKGTEYISFSDNGEVKAESVFIPNGNMFSNIFSLKKPLGGYSLIHVGSVCCSASASDYDQIPNGGQEGNAFFSGSVKALGLFMGQATSAQFADLAERYRSDCLLRRGEVVSIGGNEEITKTTLECDPNIFGVVSESPAFRMNNGPAFQNEDHPFVALSGRIPCLILGLVNKGDRIVSSNLPGVARKATETEAQNYQVVIGRALKNKTTLDVDYCEVVVGAK